MRKKIPRTSAAVAACAALAVLGVTGAGTPDAGTQGRPAAKTLAGQASRTPAPGTQLWVKRLSAPRNAYGRPSRVAVSPDAKTVFVTAAKRTASSADDYATVAYNAATGARRWAQRYNGPANSSDTPSAVAVSPTGKTVFVTGTSDEAVRVDYATIAYNAATGAQLWVTRSHDPVNMNSMATSVAVSPDGHRVFVTGTSYNTGHPGACLTVAYDAATGAPLWAKRYTGPSGISLAVSPTGNTVFVTGGATIAYRAATGARLWLKRYLHHPGSSVAVSPDGNRVFVAGIRWLSQAQSDYLTTAYRAATGARLWTRGYSKPAHTNRAAAVAVSPTGKKVFITGISGNGSRSDYLTIAYRASTGARLWLQRYSKPAHSNGATSLAVSPAGGTVYVTGGSYAADNGNYATVAYRGTTGARLWVRGHNGPAGGDDYATSVAVSPDGRKVFVTGSSWGGKGYDYVTIAYQG